MLCGIDLIGIVIAAIVLTALYFILNAIPFLATFRNIINILIAALAAIFVVVKVIAPLLSCAGI